ncbi:MAG TPA: histidine kinase [Chitinophagaceae bacterium]|jgi:hypothetical protein|nr:histidine kinase [Chitinophagaceae bacterium]
MIKDSVFKALFIPLVGMLLPVLSHLARYDGRPAGHVLLSNLFFIFTSFLIWQGCVGIVSRVRRTPGLRGRTFTKLILLCFPTTLFGAGVTSISAASWQQYMYGEIRWDLVWRTAGGSALVALILTLVYEILFLSKEHELDTKIVDQLDRERQQAEIAVLRNELDPHFMFNSLIALSHLIDADPPKALLFNRKLAQSYKYLLMNKDRELISLEEELRFIEDYFFLLQIRHDHKLQLRFDIDQARSGATLILPCALQILVENAIKHNQFSEEKPLQILIALNDGYLRVENNVHTKAYSIESTNTGLRNLSTRSRLICNREIIIHKSRDRFCVKLPVLQNQPYDNSHRN